MTWLKSLSLIGINKAHHWYLLCRRRWLNSAQFDVSFYSATMPCCDSALLSVRPNSPAPEQAVSTNDPINAVSASYLTPAVQWNAEAGMPYPFSTVTKYLKAEDCWTPCRKCNCYCCYSIFITHLAIWFNSFLFSILHDNRFRANIWPYAFCIIKK